MLNYKQIWHGIKPIRWLNKFNLTSSSNTASSSTTVFVPPANNIKIENNEIKTELASKNIDKGKSILGAPPKFEKKDIKNPRVKKANSQKPKQKK